MKVHERTPQYIPIYCEHLYLNIIYSVLSRPSHMTAFWFTQVSSIMKGSTRSFLPSSPSISWWDRRRIDPERCTCFHSDRLRLHHCRMLLSSVYFIYFFSFFNYTECASTFEESLPLRMSIGADKRFLLHCTFGGFSSRSAQLHTTESPCGYLLFWYNDVLAFSSRNVFAHAIMTKQSPSLKKV